ncbi:hypothetical protein [Vibrio mediterranei]|uniref:hypothetical protein n=1 Tax=Vibrio mediterranei TaxID=689 RepID=UPI0040697AA3
MTRETIELTGCSLDESIALVSTLYGLELLNKSAGESWAWLGKEHERLLISIT